ncbi:MAG: hypothetical protein ACHQRO_12995, partial [Vicinamibacteria bacterium]
VGPPWQRLPVNQSESPLGVASTELRQALRIAEESINLGIAAPWRGSVPVHGSGERTDVIREHVDVATKLRAALAAWEADVDGEAKGAASR